MILEQKKKLEKVRENIDLSNEVLNELKTLLYKSGTPKQLLDKLIYVVTTKSEFEFKEKDLVKSLDLLYHANKL